MEFASAFYHVDGDAAAVVQADLQGVIIGGAAVGDGEVGVAVGGGVDAEHGAVVIGLQGKGEVVVVLGDYGGGGERRVVGEEHGAVHLHRRRAQQQHHRRHRQRHRQAQQLLEGLGREGPEIQHDLPQAEQGRHQQAGEMGGGEAGGVQRRVGQEEQHRGEDQQGEPVLLRNIPAHKGHGEGKKRPDKPGAIIAEKAPAHVAEGHLEEVDEGLADQEENEGLEGRLQGLLAICHNEDGKKDPGLQIHAHALEGGVFKDGGNEEYRRHKGGDHGKNDDLPPGYPAGEQLFQHIVSPY